MSEKFDEVVDNLKEPNSWVRLVFMIVFGVLLYLIIAPVILIIVIAQTLFALFTGLPNPNLKHFSNALEQYISQILKFLLYGVEDKPFPFTDFPRAKDDDSGDSVSVASKKETVKKSSTKKTAQKRGARKKSKAKEEANGARGNDES
ncbi:MAG: hypothetical protein CMQ28_06050 [Gammaproteobacteria bacterium]|nr:hypothetical protein [Gammaproteobacteria bacterium]|tara:strand:+ start:15731 stop:16171 length:441 start_codon:yes stop_codon:yes gene_type:complete